MRRSLHGFDDAPRTTPPNGAQPGAWGDEAPSRGRRWVQLGSVALVAGLVTTGCSQLAGPAATQPQANSFSAGPAPVVQGNPVAPDWAATAAAVTPSVVAITVGSPETASGVGQGSGVLIDNEGHIVTNAHVINGGSGGRPALAVTLNDGRTFDASVSGSDTATDLAVITLQDKPNDLRPISFGDSDKLRVGDPVMAVGNPLGLAGTVTTGIVSALNRPVSAEGSSDPSGRGRPEPVVTNAIQTSAAINPGNSGGALVDASGRLVGINASIATAGPTSRGNIGIGFAIPVNEARSVADQLLKNGKVQHAFLGVSLDQAFVSDGTARRSAAIITQVTGGSAAEKAGIKAGDAVVAVDGEAVEGPESLIAQIRERRAGEQVTLTIIRDGQRQDVRATLGSR